MLFETAVCCKYQKLKGDPLETKQISKKSHNAEKIHQRGDPIVSSGFLMLWLKNEFVDIFLNLNLYTALYKESIGF